MADERTQDTPVTILAYDPSENSLGRPLLLAELLAHTSDVRIVGVSTRRELWPAANSTRVPVELRQMTSVLGYAPAARWLRKRVLGRRVIVHKPHATTLGLALLAGIPPAKLLLDIDDWELGFAESYDLKGASTARRAWRGIRELAASRRLNSYGVAVLLDRLASRFPHRLVSNTWLRRRFGGRLLPHVRDTETLDPALVDASAVRSELGMQGRVWAGFIGTLRAHKGVEDLVEALALLRMPNAPGLFLAGLNQNDAYARQVRALAQARLGDSRVRVVGLFEFDKLARWVSAADFICLPSRAEAGTLGQIPAKVFDALAMGKPVIASRVNDLPEVLDGCGILVEPGDTHALASAISALAQDPARQRELGRRGRERAIQNYSYAAGRRVLREALSQLSPV